MRNMFDSQIKDIQKTTMKLGLELENDPESFYEKRRKNLFTTPARLRKDNTKVVFRYAFGRLISSLEREIELYTMAYDKGVSCVPTIIDHGVGSSGIWMIYKYNDGQTMGTVYQFASSAPLGEITDLIMEIPKIGWGDMDKTLFRSYDRQRWGELIEIICQKHSALSESEQVANLLNALSGKSVPISDCFCHGDIHSKNIIKTKDGIVFIDWESSHFNSCAFDLSFVYVRAYDQKERNNIIKKFLKRYPDKLPELFFCIAVNLLRDYFEWHSIIEGESEVADIKEIINGRDIRWICLDLENQIKYITGKLSHQAS